MDQALWNLPYNWWFENKNVPPVLPDVKLDVLFFYLILRKSASGLAVCKYIDLANPK